MTNCFKCKNKVFAKFLCKAHYAKKYRSEHIDRMRETWTKNHKSVNTERIKKYRKTQKGKEATRRAVKKYESTHLKERKNWNKAKQVKIQPCEICSKYPAHRHHPDINKPLKIIFLCPFHHKQIHKKMV